MTHLLQKRDNRGLIRTVAKSDLVFDQIEVLKQFGPGNYCDKETSPRFHVVWKNWLGDPIDGTELSKQSKKLESLDNRTKYLAAGEVILTATEIAGFALSAREFANHGLRINRLEAALHIINLQNPLGFVCPGCQNPLLNLMADSYCGFCGVRVDWTNAITTQPTGNMCPHCYSSVRFDQRFCTKCGIALSIRTVIPVDPQSPSSPKWSGF